LAPRPQSAFAEGAKPEPYLAQPASAEQLAQMHRGESPILRDHDSRPRADSRVPTPAIASASQLVAAAEPVPAKPRAAPPVSTRNPPSQSDAVRPHLHAASAPRPATPAMRSEPEAVAANVPATPRAQLELASLLESSAGPTSTAPRARTSQMLATTRPAATVLKVTPRIKSEAELGLKNPW
jgi:hypothetical protein